MCGVDAAFSQVTLTACYYDDDYYYHYHQHRRRRRGHQTIKHVC